MRNNKTPLSCWVITEGIAGTENQCIAVAEAMGLEPVIKRVQLHQPWKSLSPYLRFESAGSFKPRLEGPWPDLLLTSGRKAIAASRYIKKQSPSTFTCHIQDPRICPTQFDLVAVPEHDPTRGENVIVTAAAPNRLTPDKLTMARARFRAVFEDLRAPRVAVLIGGKSKVHKLTPQIVKTLSAQLSALDASLMITTSRRTGAKNEQLLRGALAGRDNVYFWDGESENPYLGMLAWADTILVTNDSASMLSDGASTGKPVYMIPLEGGGTRLDTLHSNLIKRGAVRPFTGTLEHWDYTPLQDAKLIAREIGKQLKTGA